MSQLLCPGCSRLFSGPLADRALSEHMRECKDLQDKHERTLRLVLFWPPWWH